MGERQMTNALTVYQEFDNIQRAALALHKSGYFKDSKSEAQAIVKVMAGAELGLPPFASMTGIHIIQGKPALGSNVIATLVKNDPRYDYRIRQCDNVGCVIAWFENGQEVGESSFTAKEAQTVKQWDSKKNLWVSLSEKHNYKNYPSDMYFARAITRGARRFAPGVFGGSPVYTPEELGADENEDGHIIDVTPQQVREVASEIIDAGLGDGVEEVITDFDDLQSATDSRKETSPQKQAQRKPKWNPGETNWQQKAIKAPNFSAFAAAVVAAGIGYNHAKHVEKALEKLALTYGETDNKELWDILESRKADSE
jgi:uncharacterized protein (DUF697 family)